MINLERLFLIVSLSVILHLSACNMPLFDDMAEDGVSIISPMHGARLNAGESVEIISEASVSSGGIVQHLTVNSQSYRSDTFTAEFASGQVYQPWIPPGPGEYILQVIVETSGGGKVVSDPITVYVDVREEETPTATEEEGTPTQTFTPTITPSPTVGTTTATAEINLNCRVGPGYDYETIDGLRQGETSPVVGVNDQRTWGLVEGPHDTRQCWVPLDYTIVFGDLASSLVYPAPPLSPKPTKKVELTKEPTETSYGPTTP
jgi:hypothetical protein